MKKVIIVMIGLILMISIAFAELGNLCEDTPEITGECTMVTPVITCASYNYTVVNNSGTLVETGSLSNFSTGTYYFNWTIGKGEYVTILCDGTSREITVLGEESDMSLSITLFVLALTFGVFFLPFKMKHMSKNKYLDAVLKGCCIEFGLFLLTLDTVMIWTMAESAGISLTGEFRTYLYIINTALYVVMVVVVLSFMRSILLSWRIDKQKRDNGEATDE